MASEQPLWSMWELSRDPRGTALTMEFTALANHRKAIRSEIASFAERYRAEQLVGMRELFARYDVDTDRLPAVVGTVLMTSISRFLVIEEETLGMASGHDETVAFVERFLCAARGGPTGVVTDPAAARCTMNARDGGARRRATRSRMHYRASGLEGVAT